MSDIAGGESDISGSESEFIGGDSESIGDESESIGADTEISIIHPGDAVSDRHGTRGSAEGRTADLSCTQTSFSPRNTQIFTNHAAGWQRIIRACYSWSGIWARLRFHLRESA